MRYPWGVRGQAAFLPVALPGITCETNEGASGALYVLKQNVVEDVAFADH